MYNCIKLKLLIQLIYRAKDDNTLLWKYLNNVKTKNKGIKELSIDGRIITDRLIMAQKFNSCSVPSVEELIQHFPSLFLTQVDYHSAQDGSQGYFYIKQIDERKPAQIMTKLSHSNSNDIYNINYGFLKKYINNLTKPLTYLVNLSINTLMFPLRWKKAVVPTYKEGRQDSE